jgi:hypothetical protein
MGFALTGWSRKGWSLGRGSILVRRKKGHARQPFARQRRLFPPRCLHAPWLGHADGGSTRLLCVAAFGRGDGRRIGAGYSERIHSLPEGPYDREPTAQASPGGMAPRSTRSIRAASRTAMAMAWVIWPASPRGSIMWPRWASMRSGSRPSSPRRCAISAMTFRTIAMSIRCSARWPISTRWSPGRTNWASRSSSTRSMPTHPTCTLVHAKPSRPRRPARRLVRLGRSEGRRHAAQQLAIGVRRPGVDLGCAPRAILHAHLPEGAAAAQRPQPGCAGCAAGRGAVLAGARGGRASGSMRSTIRCTTRACATIRPRPIPAGCARGRSISRSSAIASRTPAWSPSSNASARCAMNMARSTPSPKWAGTRPIAECRPTRAGTSG